MHGAIRKRDIIAHPRTTIQCFGWHVFVRSLLAPRDRTFLSIVGQTELPPTVTAQLPELIARGTRLELRAMRLYRSLAQRFVDVGPMRELFADLARQEESHAELLELCHASSSPKAWAERYFEPWRAAVAHLEDEMRSFERRGEEISSVGDALQLVIDLESSEINAAFMTIVDGSRSPFVRVVKAFRSAQQEHTELICRKIPALAPDLADACQALQERHQG
jgi:rubrerythrin